MMVTLSTYDAKSLFVGFQISYGIYQSRIPNSGNRGLPDETFGICFGFLLEYSWLTMLC